METACLCTTLSEASAGSPEGRGLKSDEGLFAYLAGSGCWLSARTAVYSFFTWSGLPHHMAVRFPG